MEPLQGMPGDHTCLRSDRNSSMSCMACTLKLSSTFVKGVSRTCIHTTQATAVKVHPARGSCNGDQCKLYSQGIAPTKDSICFSIPSIQTSTNLERFVLFLLSIVHGRCRKESLACLRPPWAHQGSGVILRMRKLSAATNRETRLNVERKSVSRSLCSYPIYADRLPHANGIARMAPFSAAVKIGS